MVVAWGVEWSLLRHSAGEASDLPELLERLTDSDADAVLELAGYVTRGIDSAAPAVARVVLDVLARPDAVARDYLLSLVAGTCGAVHAKYLVDLKRIRAEAVGEDERPMRAWEETQAATEAEKPWMLASCAAATERLPFLLTLTRDPDPEVRLEVAHLLALLDPVADRVLPALRDAVAGEADERVRAGFVVAVSVASARSGQDRTGVAAWLRQLAHDAAMPDSVRAAAALTLHPVDGRVRCPHRGDRPQPHRSRVAALARAQEGMIQALSLWGRDAAAAAEASERRQPGPDGRTDAGRQGPVGADRGRPRAVVPHRRRHPVRRGAHPGGRDPRSPGGTRTRGAPGIRSSGRDGCARQERAACDRNDPRRPKRLRRVDSPEIVEDAYHTLLNSCAREHAQPRPTDAPSGGIAAADISPSRASG